MKTGKARPVACRCSFTLICGECLSRAKPYVFTPGGPTKPCHPGFYEPKKGDEA
jgi:hypothetical protein